MIPLSGTIISVAMGHEIIDYQILGGILILTGVTSSILFKAEYGAIMLFYQASSFF
jgi:hypothetical protein